MVDSTVDVKVNHEEETMEVGDIIITSVRTSGLLLLLSGVLLLPLHLDDVMNLGVVKHIEYVKHLNVPTISTAYHSPALIEEHSK